MNYSNQLVNDLATQTVNGIWKDMDPKTKAKEVVKEMIVLINNNATKEEISKHAAQVGFLAATNSQFKEELDKLTSSLSFS